MTKDRQDIPMRPIEIWIPDIPNAVTEIKKSCEVERRAKGHDEDLSFIADTGAWDD